MVKSRKMRWGEAEHIAHIREKRNWHRILEGKREGKITL
jgi:hypothetical protein